MYIEWCNSYEIKMSGGARFIFQSYNTYVDIKKIRSLFYKITNHYFKDEHRTSQTPAP